MEMATTELDRVFAPADPARGGQMKWKKRLSSVLEQEPMIETRVSMEMMHAATCQSAPRSVFVGMGLCNSRQVSAAVPFDVMGMLSAANQICQAIESPTLIVMVADRHALLNDFDPHRIEQQARESVRLLRRIRNLMSWDHMLIVRASDYHDTPEYQRILREVERRADPRTHGYVTHEVADIEFMHQVSGGLLKVGWTVTSASNVPRVHDEVSFDQSFQQLMGAHVMFVYAKAGRALDQNRPKCSPYVTTDTQNRLCLAGGENVAAKLQLAKRHLPPDIVNAVTNHSKAVLKSLAADWMLMRGTLEQRLQAVIDKVVGTEQFINESEVFHAAA